MAVAVTIDGHDTQAAQGVSLFECAATAGVYVPTSCRGQGKCRECLVELEAGHELLSPREEAEGHLGGDFRMSCRARILPAVGEIRCHTLRRGALRIEDGAPELQREVVLEAGVRREGRAVVRAGVRAGELLAENASRILGIAVDIGTTTVVVRLHDLERGNVLATRAFENPQRFGGSDVMARILFDDEHPGRLLQRTLLGYLGHAIEALPCAADEVFELVVCGNTTMRDLFFGLDVHSVGQRPYRSSTEHALRAGERTTTSLTSSARKLRLPVHAEALVYGLPVVGGHVGADTAAALLATGLFDARGPCLLMDIGTNTELVAGGRGRLLAASCPAGPAFEGGAVACGMPALDGAVERVQLRADGSQELRVIGDQDAQGICGSGLVDLMAELLRTDLMNAQGRLDDRDRFELAGSGGLFLSEADINELAQAKGANVAGTRCVLDRLGARMADVEHLYLAGGFARHLDLDAARRIGLIPDLPDERISRVGNAAIEGASRALLSLSERKRIEQLVSGIEHVELEVHPSFFDYFVDGCQFVRVSDGGG